MHTSSQGLDTILESHSEVFEDDLGKLKVRLQVNPEAPPRFFRSRPVPFSLRTKVEMERDQLVKTVVIEPVQYSDWASPMSQW